MLSHEAVLLFTDYMLAMERSQKTVIGYQSDLRNFERFYETRYNGQWYVEDTTREDVEQFMFFLKSEKHLGPSSRNRILYGLKTFFQIMVNKGVCSENVADGISPIRYSKKERHFLSEDEITRFINGIEHPVIRAATTTLAYTGIRISECCGLQLKDVDLDERYIEVVNGKGHKSRRVPIADKLEVVLRNYKNEFRAKATITDRFFATLATGQLSPSYFNYVLTKTSEKLGLKKTVTAHTFRHSLATNLIRRGANVVQVQKILGHSSLQITSVYTHATLQDLAEAVNTL